MTTPNNSNNSTHQLNTQALAALHIQPPAPAHHFQQAAPTTPENQGTNANRERDRDLRQGRQTANRAHNITPRSLF